MDVTAHELRTIKLREAFRGYKQDEVDDLLDRVAGTVERLQAQIQRLSERLEQAEGEAGVGREADEMLRRTLLLAQRTADAAVAEAQERARRVLSESEAHAHSIVSSAEEEARRIAIAERQRIESDIRDLGRKREELLSDVEALEQASRDHRRRMREFLEAELARVDARAVPEAPPEEIELDERQPVPVPVPAAGPAVEVEAEADADGGGMVAAAPVPAPMAPPASEPAAPDAEAHAEAEPAPDGLAETGEWDPAEAWGPAEDSPDILPARRRRWRLREPEDEPHPSDDRFFSELRAAVDDDTPLGPRDEDGQEHEGRGPERI